MINGLLAEAKLKRPYMTDDEYWEIINGLANNTLADSLTLISLREYCDTHDEEKLIDSAEDIIIRFFKLNKY